MKVSSRIFVSKTGQNDVTVKTAVTSAKDDVLVIEDSYHNGVFIDMSVCVDALEYCASKRGMTIQEYVNSVLKEEKNELSNKE